jgi:hypothetical protein
MECKGCKKSLDQEWAFCPFCGLAAVKVIDTKLAEKSELKERQLAERFLLLANDYKALTGHNLEGDVLKAFVAHPASSTLSVVEGARRIRAGQKCRRGIGAGKYSLDLGLWLETVYEINEPDSQSRVWITDGGTKYHSVRDCKGMRDGQEYARRKGKETYNPQFVPIRRAAFVMGLMPCLVCKPRKYVEN